MQLNFQIYGTGYPLLILHGLFGSLDNWHGISQRLGEYFQVFAVDLRNHGRSPHSDIFNYEVMAADIAELMEAQRLTRAHLLGHSMGGKVGMLFALRHPDRVEKLVIADMTPKAYPPWHRSILAALRAVNLASFKARNEIDAALAPAIPEPAVRQFLLKNVARNEMGGFTWKMNLHAIDENYQELLGAIPSVGSFEGPALFIRGGQSEYVEESDCREIQALFPRAELETVPNAGHWLHAEAPDEFIRLVKKFLC